MIRCPDAVPDRPTLRALAAIVGALFLLRLVVAPRNSLSDAASAAIDALILGGLSLVVAVPPSRPRIPRLLAACSVGIFIALYATAVFWHAFFLDIAAEYQFSPTGVSLGAVGFFFEELAPRRGWALLAGFWLLVFLARGWTPLDRVLPTGLLHFPSGRRRMVGLALVAGGLGCAALPGARHPLSASLRDAARRIRSPSAQAAGLVLPTDHLDLRRVDARPLASQFRRVLVFVMEGVTRQALDSVIGRLPSTGSFFHQVRPHAIRYRGYYTVNQESRTARMAMLHSLMIPHEAYLPDWERLFGPLYRQGGMIGALNASGWRTALAIPLFEVPWDLRHLPWTTTLALADDDGDRSGMLCLAPTPFDRGCEDRILLDRVQALLSEPGQVFLFQAFLFGHTDKWEDATGLGRIDYYDAYMRRLYDWLRDREMLDDTLIVVTSDHGPRTLRELLRVASYEVPLWLIHPSFPDEVREGYFANTEFRDLVFEAMRAGTPPQPRHRNYLIATGPTGRGMFGCTTPDGRFGFLGIREEGLVSIIHTSPTPPADLRSCIGTFFDYRRRFDAEAASQRNEHAGPLPD